MEKFKRIEMKVRSEKELRQQYGDWEIIEIDTQSYGAKHYYGRFLDGNNKWKLRIMDESNTGLHLNTSIQDWEQNCLGTINTLKEVTWYRGEFVTYIILRKCDTIIYAEVTNGKKIK